MKKEKPEILSYCIDLVVGQGIRKSCILDVLNRSLSLIPTGRQGFWLGEWIG